LRVEATWDLAEPDPASLIESLRSFGYTLETAVADVVDNSISAGAHHVDVTFEWDGGGSRVVVTDDGCGMTADELVSAMRPGSRSPSEHRDPDDLGRFGLGLKTASFSQCRQLTVASRRLGGPVATRTWDLDTVVQTHEWRLLRQPPAGCAALVAGLGARPQGTVVVWSDLDRVVTATGPEDNRAQRRFLERVNGVGEHLRMTFHRFLGSAAGKVRLRINGRQLLPWDPFLERSDGGQVLPEERLPFGSGSVVVRPFVLPHHSHLPPGQSEDTGRTETRTWNSLQGFYVYRNRRLLVAGDWLGLGFSKEEHFRLARIQIDLPNDIDESWQIDVKKSTARPPNSLRPDLQRIATVTRQRAVEVYRHRGKVLARRSESPVVALWEQVLTHGKISYRLNRSHPAVVDAVSAPTQTSVRSLLRLIEEAVPLALITLNSSERPQDHAEPFEAAGAEVATLAATMTRRLVQGGCPHSEAVQRVLSMEPFQRFPELAASLATRSDTEPT
jgi:hypothetical protein